MKALSPKNWLITLMLAIAFLILLITASYGQQTFPAGNPTGQFHNKGFMVSDSGFQLPYRLTTSPYWPKQGLISYSQPDSGVYFNTGFQWLKLLTSASSGGTVTNIATSTGIIGGPITTTGTLQIDSSKIPKWTDTLPGNNWLASTYWVKQQGFVPYAGATSDVNLGAHNIIVNNAICGYQSIAQSTATVNLTPASPNYTLFHGSGGYQVVYLPNTALLTLGQSFQIDNDITTYAVNVYDYSGTYLISIISGGHTTFTCSSTSAQHWDLVSVFINTISSTSLALTYSGYGNLDIEMGAAGTPGTYTNPASITTNTYGQVTAVVSGTATPVAGSGSQYAVPIFTNSVTVGNSNITDTTSTINHTSVMDTLYVYGLARFKDVPAALNSDSIFTMGTTQHTLRAVHSPIAGFGQKISWPADSFWVDTAHIPTWYDTLSGNNWLASTYWVKQQGFGSGSVTSVATSTGLIGGTITTTGTLQIDSAKIPKWTDTLSGYNWLATSYWVKQQGYGTGSVTSVATYTATGLRGGTITTSGTLYIDSTLIPRWDDTLSGNQWLATNYWVKQQGYGAGTVTSVSGTTNQIDVASGTTTPVISIHSSAILPGSPTVATPGTAAGSIATIDGTQTLTNKTITSSTDVMGGVTMTLGSDASYDIYYRNSSGILTRLANGSAGQMLQSNFGAPTWVWPNFTQYNNQTGTSYTLVLADGWQWVTSNNSGAVTFTVPPNSSVAYAVGTIIQFQNYGAGKLTFSPGAGVTINSDGTFLSVTQNRGAYLQKTATNVWILAGGISN